MLTLINILNEESNKKLRIFDFDDTLIISNSKIWVTHKDKSKEALSTSEYANYKKKKGDIFDYSEFKKVIRPKQIKFTTNLLKQFISDVGEKNIVILTARSYNFPIKKYLYKIGLSNVDVIALGNSNPELKKDWIENKIKEGYNDIFFIDDSRKNIKAVNELKSKYPNIKLKTYQIKHRGNK